MSARRGESDESVIRRMPVFEYAMPKLVDILLVEDDAKDAELVLEAFRQRRISTNVVHVLDGYEAMDFISQSGMFASWSDMHVPKVILLDLKLKTVSGLDVLRQIKAEDRTKTIPVVVFTASQRDIDLIESYRLGVNSYVMKPADPAKFAQVVGDLGNYWLNINQPPAH